MATAKPKRMIFGGMAKGPMSNVQKPNTLAPRGAIMPERLTQQQAQQRAAAMTQSNMQAAAKSQMPSQIKAPMPKSLQSAPNASAIGSIQKMKQGIGHVIPTMSQAQKVYSQQKSGAMPIGSQSVKTGLGTPGAAGRGISGGDMKMAGLMKKGGKAKKPPKTNW
jgi:hypothetical protein